MSTELDKCAESDNTCPENSTCVNNDGSAECQCLDGFLKNQNETCEGK